MYQVQNDFEQISVGAFVKQSSITFGAWYKHKDAMSFLIGYESQNYKIGYSYDHNIYAIGKTINSGAHEISLVVKLKNKHKHIKAKRYRIAACPSF